MSLCRVRPAEEGLLSNAADLAQDTRRLVAPLDPLRASVRRSLRRWCMGGFLRTALRPSTGFIVSATLLGDGVKLRATQSRPMVHANNCLRPAHDDSPQVAVHPERIPVER